MLCGGSSLIGNFSQIFPFFFSDTSPYYNCMSGKKSNCFMKKLFIGPVHFPWVWILLWPFIVHGHLRAPHLGLGGAGWGFHRLHSWQDLQQDCLLQTLQQHQPRWRCLRVWWRTSQTSSRIQRSYPEFYHITFNDIYTNCTNFWLKQWILIISVWIFILLKGTQSWYNKTDTGQELRSWC